MNGARDLLEAVEVALLELMMLLLVPVVRVLVTPRVMYPALLLTLCHAPTRKLSFPQAATVLEDA